MNGCVNAKHRTIHIDHRTNTDMNTIDTRFTRSRSNRMIAGVMGGIAQRFGWDANLLRVVFVLVSLLSAAFPGILVYLILWLLMPEGND